MTEQEAIEMMQGYQIADAVDRAEYDAFGMAIDALEEIQKYRDIGTVEKFRELKESSLSVFELIIMWAKIQKSKEYEAIGTVEECREAMEKQTPKEVRYIGMNQSIGTKIGSCPMCDGRPLRKCDFEYCPDCGQKLDWEVAQ